ncbi:hypothetical protein DFP74_0589 [Nocardiopsis sp. Huas11]|uniref:hypothetical protein n=1 Tax=Nocardiopsis sp. Huas11 TaxID=2183912 RepID=UPI000EAEDB88|nr:hypothetical protein [Nocardiopsis sp. Huas11]RKS05007.1 hypothetical protein DFP74_0589 [Nocardiopsis sp. Huas11]
MHVVQFASHQVDWPVRGAAIREETAYHQHRTAANHVDTALNSFGTVVLRQMLSGTRGVDKTRLPPSMPLLWAE